ncbi:uncharacterized protein [Symphalangus syndactylus]|uniref:uncharacterized protein n=1 Tax=Symphalangus syndactylus TaxID=9590 RepID=UPI00300421A3
MADMTSPLSDCPHPGSPEAGAGLFLERPREVCIKFSGGTCCLRRWAVGGDVPVLTGVCSQGLATEAQARHRDAGWPRPVLPGAPSTLGLPPALMAGEVSSHATVRRPGEGIRGTGARGFPVLPSGRTQASTLSLSSSSQRAHAGQHPLPFQFFPAGARRPAPSPFPVLPSGRTQASTLSLAFRQNSSAARPLALLTVLGRAAPISSQRGSFLGSSDLNCFRVSFSEPRGAGSAPCLPVQGWGLPFEAINLGFKCGFIIDNTMTSC